VNRWLTRGHSVFWALVALLVVLLVSTLGRLPLTVASHFGGSGAANGWSTRQAYAALLLSIGILLPLGVVGLVHAVTQRGPQLLNIPFKDYWRQAEHGAEAVRLVRAYTWWLACIMTAVALATHWFILKANTLQPPRLATTGFGVVYIGMLVVIALWIAGFYRLLRPSSLRS
jgi:uncharacterized membrane protein